ncbi:alkaline phosphatase D family protein [Allorhizocola rhizosphaerae]|uniref:alkaline phosphatase D family protein n=1 Tax=Allorhizocola rhizosphaerae TaxID=1872709 RepID=UPI000E3B8AF7|nr:alkaline phosphatase D family protein [Allorhizocola rhizosphaerae]
MASLILGPQLRRVTRDQAVLWLQTDAPARVTVRIGEASVTVDTFETRGVHVALPVITPPKMTMQYAVELDGEPVWPLPGMPPSVITVRDENDLDATIVFGSCREAKRHPDPDALIAYAARAMVHEQPLPDLLALIGDQIYADDVWSFAEYVELYRQAWSEPHVRWLLSTVSTVMIFDDHEIHDDWNSSAAWLAEMRARPGWEDHLGAGLESYWLFQHLGNEPAAKWMPDDWSFTVDIGRTRLIMLDCRGSRQLTGERRMFPQAQWDRLREQAQADCDHLVLASSLPWLLGPAIHHAESAMEVLSHRYPKMEMLRRKYDLEHWSAVGHSFDELTEVVEAVNRPATVSVIGGDVHHSYIAKVRPGLHQITCSPLNNSVDAKMRLMLKMGWWRPLFGPAALVARLLGVPRDHIDWELLTKPYFGNAIATLTHRGRTARVLLEGTRPDGTLYPVASADLT